MVGVRVVRVARLDLSTGDGARVHHVVDRLMGRARAILPVLRRGWTPQLPHLAADCHN